MEEEKNEDCSTFPSFVDEEELSEEGKQKLQELEE